MKPVLANYIRKQYVVHEPYIIQKAAKARVHGLWHVCGLDLGPRGSWLAWVVVVQIRFGRRAASRIWCEARLRLRRWASTASLAVPALDRPLLALVSLVVVRGGGGGGEESVVLVARW